MVGSRFSRLKWFKKCAFASSCIHWRRKTPPFIRHEAEAKTSPSKLPAESLCEVRYKNRDGDGGHSSQRQGSFEIGNTSTPRGAMISVGVRPCQKPHSTRIKHVAKVAGNVKASRESLQSRNKAVLYRNKARSSRTSHFALKTLAFHIPWVK